MKENCKGCAMLSVTSGCYILNKVKKGYLTNFDCPCANCIIKVMCERSCDEVNNYFDKVVQMIERAKEEGKKTIDEDLLKQWAQYKYKTQKSLRTPHAGNV